MTLLSPVGQGKVGQLLSNRARARLAAKVRERTGDGVLLVDALISIVRNGQDKDKLDAIKTLLVLGVSEEDDQATEVTGPRALSTSDLEAVAAEEDAEVEEDPSE